MDRQDRIRKLAYDIWEREGRPEGRDQEHWYTAERIVAVEGKPMKPPRQAGSAQGGTKRTRVTAGR